MVDAEREAIVLSHDAACFNDWLDMNLINLVAPNWKYTHISEDVIPALLSKGVTQEQITQMLVDNPKRVFSQRQSY